jgi:membrane protease YdiL (CAAX protease family)
MASWFSTYLTETRKPVYSAALILPFFVIYHTGTLVFRTTYINGADALIIRLLALLSVRSVFASALVLVAGFLVWQLRTHANWKIDRSRLAWLYAESLAYAFLLLFLTGWLTVRLSFAAPAPRQGILERIVLYCGAGIYEELLFRAVLVGLLLILFHRLFGMNRTMGAVSAVIAAAAIFSLFHYLGPAGDRFQLVSFLQRFGGGVYFSILFVTRGFGVAAATHALYDVLVGLVLT